MWKSSRGSSSFGMVLVDRFQNNPNMYFPDTPMSVPLAPLGTEKEEEDWSDADTLVHNMSEGSFDKVSVCVISH